MRERVRERNRASDEATTMELLLKGYVTFYNQLD